MNVKISEMPSATSLDGTELVPIVQSGVSKNVTKQILTNNNYSTSEQVVGTWIDGKPLYRKTIKHNFTMSNGAYTQNIDISSLNIDKVANIQAIIEKTFSATNSDYESTWQSSNTDYCRAFYRKSNSSDNKVLRFLTAGTNTGGIAYITIEYTKTTD